MREIVKGLLYQGDRDDAIRVAGHGGAWTRHGIRGVVCAATELHMSYDPLLSALLLPVSEGEPTPPALFDLATRFARMCDGHLLVHCSAGVNRSNAVCAAILVDAVRTVERALAKTNPSLPPALASSIRSWAHGR